MVIFVFFVVGGLIYMFMLKFMLKVLGLQFIKQGMFMFYVEQGDQVISIIDIEIKVDDMGWVEGMMWCKFMEDNQGMFFIMEWVELQFFWMCNIYVFFDIMFISEDQCILNICKNVQF